MQRLKRPICFRLKHFQPTTSDPAHVTNLSWIKAEFYRDKKKKKKQNRSEAFWQKEENKMAVAATVGERFNLKIGKHSSFLQMKARKWKWLESCLLWKSKVMNNVSVSIIRPRFNKSTAPEGWETPRGCTSDLQSGSSPCVVVNFCCSPLAQGSLAGRSGTAGKQNAPACDLTHGFAAAVKAADLRRVANQGMALLLMKRHRSIE